MKVIHYKKFRLEPFYDKGMCDYGVEIVDKNSPKTEFPAITAAETEKEAIEWAKEVCDNRRYHESTCLTV